MSFQNSFSSGYCRRRYLDFIRALRCVSHLQIQAFFMLLLRKIQDSTNTIASNRRIVNTIKHGSVKVK